MIIRKRKLLVSCITISAVTKLRTWKIDWQEHRRDAMRLRWTRGSVLAFGPQVREFTPGRSCRICRANKSSARLPLEGK
jgi:hypothetical protein